MIDGALPPTFTTAQARAAGVHPRTLYRWRDDGEVAELSRGVFRRADAPQATYPDLLAVTARAPRAVVCTLSAAAVHDLTDVVPREVQVAVPDGTHPPRITHPPTTVLRFDPATHGIGRATVEAAPGELVPVYDPARTVVDLIRLRHRFGHDVAWSALHRYLDRPDASPRQVHAYARALGTETLVTTALDVATARLAAPIGPPQPDAPTSTCRTRPGAKGARRRSCSRSTRWSGGWPA